MSETKKQMSKLWLMVMLMAIVAMAIILFALIPRSADIAVNPGSTILDLSSADSEAIAGQSDRFTVSGQSIIVSGAEPITIKGNGTEGEWSVLIREAKDVTIAEGTKISNTFFALNMPEGAALNAVSNNISINGRIISDAVYKTGPKKTKGTLNTQDAQGGALSFTDPYGNPVTGMIYVGGNDWYFGKEDGTIAIEEWVVSGDRWYFAGPDGKLLRSTWVDYNGERYYVNKKGVMSSNSWIIVDGSFFRIKEDGKMAKNEEVIIGGVTYAFDANGGSIFGNWPK